MTSKPFSRSQAAATEESTPPLIATRMRSRTFDTARDLAPRAQLAGARVEKGPMRIARPTEAMPIVAEPPAVSKPETPSRGAPDASFSKVLHGLGREIDRGEAMSARAMRGRAELSATELLALQAGIYRYSEAVELATKLVDRATGAVRTTLQSQ